MSAAKLGQELARIIFPVDDVLPVVGRDRRVGAERRLGVAAEQRLRILIRDAQAAGEFAPVASADTVTFTIFGFVNELPLWYRPTGRKRPAQLATELADLILASLGVTA